MRNFNFLSKSSSQSCGHSSVTLASTVGSLSGHRRGAMLKHVAFLLLFLFSFGVGNAWGADPSVTISVSADTWNQEGAASPGAATSITKDGITVASTNGYYTSAHIREFSGSVITISSTAGNIKSIAFTCTAQNNNDRGPGKLAKNNASDAGSYSYSGYVGTWSFGNTTSNVSTVVLKATAQCRWTQVVVTYVGSSKQNLNLGLSYSPNPIILGENNSSSPTLTGNSGSGTVTYSLEDVSPSGCVTINSSTGDLTPVKVGTATVRASVDETSSYNAGSQTCEISIVKKYTVTFHNAGGSTPSPVTQSTAGSSVSIPSATACDGWTFVGWKVGSEQSEVTSNPTGSGTWITSNSWPMNYIPTDNIDVYAVFSQTSGGSTPVVDQMTPSAISNPSSYTDWSDKSLTSNAVYAGQTSGSNSYLQMRSKNSNSGIVMTTSGGNVTKVAVTWNSTTANGRTLNVYGKNTAYEDASDLYDSQKQGTLVGSIVYGTSTELTISGDYAYIGVRSSADALYLDQIDFTIGGGGTTTWTSSPDCSEPSEPAVTATPNSLTGLNYILNAGSSAAQSFSISGTNLTNGSLTISAPTDYEVSKTSATSGFGNSVSVSANGTLTATNIWVRLKAGKAVGNYNNETVSINGCGLASAVNVTVSGSVLKPTIVADPTSISDWSTQTGSAPSPETKTITVTGSNLKADISATLTAGSDYFTITPSGLTQSAGSVNGSVVIGVKEAAYASTGTPSGTLRLSTTDGDNVDVTISLTVADDPREQFTLLTSSNLSQLGDDARLVLVYDGLLNHYAAKAGYISSNGYDEVTEDAENEFEISGNTLYAEEENHLLILTLGEMENGFSLYDGNKYLSNGTSNKIGNSDDAVAWTIAVDDDSYDAIITCTTGQKQLIKYNTNVTSAYFRAYNADAGNTAYIKAYFKASTTPKVNISGTLDAFTYMRDNGPSAAQLFKVRGNNLSENLVVTAPTNYEVCKTENGTYEASVAFTPSEGSVAESNVYIRLKSGLAINSYNGDITVSSTGATNATKAVTGSVTTPVYTVTLNTNGGTIEDGHDVTSYTEGVGATLPTAEYISKSGFSFEGWFDNNGLSGSAVTTIATNATGAKTYWAKWTELPGYDITWYVDGEAYTVGTPSIRVTSGGSITTLPSTPTSLDITSKTLVGWTTAPVNEKQANVPTPLYTAANQIPGNITENKIFYAVFAQEVLSGTFTKVTDASTLAAGDRLLIAYTSGPTAAGALSSGYLTSESVTISNNNITNKGNAVVYVLGGTSGAWTFTSTSEAGTLGCTGTTNTSLSLSEGTGTWTITINNNGNATITNTQYTGRYIRYNTNSPRYSSYASNTQNTTQPQLYREGTTRTNYTTKFVKPVVVTGVTLNKDATTLAIGATETLTATVAPANATNKNISWTTSAEGVATVTSAGVVTAVAAGEATITVTTEDGSFTDECVVTVLPTVETPTFSPAAGAINKGSKVTISCATEGASILYSLDNGDNWSAYPEGGVTINANCTLKAKATKANYTTSAVAEAAYTIIKAEQTVSFAESAISFRLESDEYNAFTGQTASSTYGSAVITYASSNTSVAEVNTNTGAVTLKDVKGTTTITATAAEDDDYASAQATYTITVLRAGVTRTGDFVLVTDASQLADGDYILIAGPVGYEGSTPILKSLSTSSAQTYQNKTVANDEIMYEQFLTEGNEAKIITLEKDGNNFAFNYGTDADLYISAGSTTSAHDLSSATSVTNNEKWTINIDATTRVATVQNVGNTTAGKLLCNSSNSQFRAYTTNSTSGTLYLYKQKDKNKQKQTLSFATPSYEFPLNESAYTSFAHQTVSGAHTAVTYTSNNDAVAVINNNTVVLNGGVGTATITATAAESEDYEHASATYTITVTAALNTVTFHYYKPADATADQTALKEESSGAGIIVPAKPANVGEYTFLGWAPATLVETQTTPDNIVAALQAGATYHPYADGEEYYAIYRRLENSDGRFYLKHNSYYAQAPASSTSTNLQNTNKLSEAAVFGIDGDKFYYYEGSTKRYISSVVTSGSTAEKRVLSFTTDIDDAKAWSIVETATNITLQSSFNNLYLYHNGNLWAAYASLTESETVTKDLTKVYLAKVYYTSTPNKMVSPVLTWAQGNETHVMEIDETYDNAATATVGGEPVSVTYSSSDETKATVNEAGVVTAHLGGLVTITATVAENPGVSRALVETYQVSITKKVPVITFDDEANYQVYVGEAYKRVLADNVSVTTDGAVTYTLSNNATASDYASINTTTGEVTGLTSGGSVIQYLYVHTEETDMYQAGEANHQFQVLALKNQPLAFGQNAYVFDMNESVDAFVNTLSGAYTTVAYTSNNTDVAEVDSESGEVTVHTNVCGTATITATAAEGQAGDNIYREVAQTYTITVNYPKPVFSMETSEIKAPVSLSIAGYDNETKLYYTDGEGDPNTLYSEPLAISETKTIRAKATSADGSLVSPIATVTLTKVVPVVNGAQDGGTITLSSDDNSLITYIILNQNGATVAEGSNVASPVVFNTELSGTYTVEATATWDVENGFTGAAYENDFVIKGKGHLPINYTGNGSGLDAEPWATKVGTLGDYNSDPKIQFKNEGCGLIAAFVEKPVQLSYQIKHNRSNTNTWEAANNVYKVQWSADGDNYYDIKVYNSSNPMSNEITEEQFDLDASARYVKWVYTTKNANIGGNVALGNIQITCEAIVIDGVNMVDIPENYDGDVIVENGVTWEPEENEVTEINNLWIKQGAVVDVTDAMLSVNDVILESQEGYSGQILEADNFEATGNAYYDLTLNTSGTMDNSKWYAFAVPFQVDAATGIQRLSNDGVASPAQFNGHYVLLKYNSAAYASAGEGWEYMTAGETLMPGKFYMIALNSNAYNRVRMTKKAGAAVNNKADLTLSMVGTGVHANWNALANNALAYANVSATGDNADLKVQVYNSATDNYTPYAYNKVTFTVGTPFFLQAAEAGTMSVNIAASNNETVKAPQREAQATEEFQIRLGENTESYYDILYVSASDEALNEYQIGHDLAKAGVSTSVPQMYVPAYGAKLCDAEFPLVNNEATFPLTFTAPNAGTYHIYVAEAAQDAELYLLQNNNIVWNLTLSPYEIALPQGTTEGYSLLLKAKAPNTATGVDEVQSDNEQCTKVVIDDHVYILRGGKMYGVDGKEVR